MTSELMHFGSRKSIWKCRLENDGYFVSASMSWLYFMPWCMYGLIQIDVDVYKQ